MLRACPIVLLLIFALPVAAHEVRPGYLEINETQAGLYDVSWKVPAPGDPRLAIYPRFSDACERVGETLTRRVGDSFVDSMTMRCPQGLTGSTIVIDGLPGTLTDTLVRIALIDGTMRIARLTPAVPGFVVPETPTLMQIAASYFGLGVEHILLGVDHLLFVLALLLLVRGFGRVVLTITAFTVAHSMTLAAATLGWVHVPSAPVEAVIALSIVLVAAEIVREQRGARSFASRRPWTVAFTFGLLHGFGFAGALNELGLPENAIPLALLFFNLGVEAGQVLFITAALILWLLVKRVRIPLPKQASYVPACAIGIVAAFWTAERIASFWS